MNLFKKNDSKSLKNQNKSAQNSLNLKKPNNNQQTLWFCIVLIGNLLLIGFLLLIWKIYGVSNVCLGKS